MTTITTEGSRVIDAERDPVKVEAELWALHRKVGKHPHIWNDDSQLMQFASAYAYYALYLYLYKHPPKEELDELRNVVQLANLKKAELLDVLRKYKPEKAKKSAKRIPLYREVRALGPETIAEIMEARCWQK